MANNKHPQTILREHIGREYIDSVFNFEDIRWRYDLYVDLPFSKDSAKDEHVLPSKEVTEGFKWAIHNGEKTAVALEMIGESEYGQYPNSYSLAHYNVRKLYHYKNEKQPLDYLGGEVYLAQKVLCQLFPIYDFFFNRETTTKNILCFFGGKRTESQKIINVLKQLTEDGFIKEWSESPDSVELINHKNWASHTVIYKIIFPDPSEVKRKLSVPKKET